MQSLFWCVLATFVALLIECSALMSQLPPNPQQLHQLQLQQQLFLSHQQQELARQRHLQYLNHLSHFQKHDRALFPTTRRQLQAYTVSPTSSASTPYYYVPSSSGTSQYYSPVSAGGNNLLSGVPIVGDLLSTTGELLSMGTGGLLSGGNPLTGVFGGASSAGLGSLLNLPLDLAQSLLGSAGGLGLSLPFLGSNQLGGGGGLLGITNSLITAPLSLLGFSEIEPRRLQQEEAESQNGLPLQPGAPKLPSVSPEQMSALLMVNRGASILQAIVKQVTEVPSVAPVYTRMLDLLVKATNLPEKAGEWGLASSGIPGVVGDKLEKFENEYHKFLQILVTSSALDSKSAVDALLDVYSLLFEDGDDEKDSRVGDDTTTIITKTTTTTTRVGGNEKASALEPSSPSSSAAASPQLAPSSTSSSSTTDPLLGGSTVKQTTANPLTSVTNSSGDVVQDAAELMVSFLSLIYNEDFARRTAAMVTSFIPFNVKLPTSG